LSGYSGWKPGNQAAGEAPVEITGSLLRELGDGILPGGIG
jgi:hypothetical protein